MNKYFTIITALLLSMFVLSCEKTNKHVALSDTNLFLQNTSEMVDLGLSVKWRGWNLGATRPEEFGDYYAWGETKPKSSFSWSNYIFCNGSEGSMTKYNSSDNKVAFKDYNYEDDAARKKLGGRWRTPTDEEWTELINKCIWIPLTSKGVNGMLVTAQNGNSVFFPYTGRYSGYYIDPAHGGSYWSSSISTDYPRCAVSVAMQWGIVYMWDMNRSDGQPIRPVAD